MSEDGKAAREGRFTHGARDPVSGQRWVHVTGEMVAAHPQGRLNMALYAVVLFLFGMAAWRLVLWTFVFGGVWMGVEVVAFLLAAAALFFRLPPGGWLGITACAMVLVDFATGMKTAWGGQIWALGEAVAAVVAGFYLLTGERPNFIYRHRYLAREGEGDV
ncbi:hypothetical protein KUV47_08040 [Vannielia litorea]|uniref:hypothetical protein n=1 Tax=Vannielia litorea TaxID=1217970 RepID=UPI001C95984A|nr:hypothetical protein [Vannielia litorea]MBY6153156.1 hypothetical protein [Vannielia litorea]